MRYRTLNQRFAHRERIYERHHLSWGAWHPLYPLTIGVSKQLLPVYDKPMIYYPLSMLMLAGIREILVISNPEAIPCFRQLLQDGSQWGLSFSYTEQNEPRGIAEAILLGKEFVGNSAVCLALGDNIFYGTGLPKRLRRAAQLEDGAIVFAYQVKQPDRFAVITFEYLNGETGIALSIEEKPKEPRSSFAVPGLYFFDQHAGKIAETLDVSHRGELEITDLNRAYLERGELRVEVLGRGVAWLDAGTHKSLLQAANFVQAVEERQGLMISCPEEIAYRMGYIDVDDLRNLAKAMDHNHYGQYLARIADDKEIPFQRT